MLEGEEPLGNSQGAAISAQAQSDGKQALEEGHRPKLLQARATVTKKSKARKILKRQEVSTAPSTPEKEPPRGSRTTTRPRTTAEGLEKGKRLPPSDGQQDPKASSAKGPSNYGKVPKRSKHTGPEGSDSDRSRMAHMMDAKPTAVDAGHSMVSMQSPVDERASVPSPAEDHPEKDNKSYPSNADSKESPQPQPTSQGADDEARLPETAQKESSSTQDLLPEHDPEPAEVMRLQQLLHPHLWEFIPSLLLPERLGILAPETRQAMLSGQDALITGTDDQRKSLAWAYVSLGVSKVLHQQSMHVGNPRLAKAYVAGHGITALVIHYRDEATQSTQGFNQATRKLLGPIARSRVMYDADVKRLRSLREKNRITMLSSRYKIAFITHIYLRKCLRDEALLARFRNLEVIVLDGPNGKHLNKLARDLKHLPIRTNAKPQRLIIAARVTGPVRTLAGDFLAEDHKILKAVPKDLEDKITLSRNDRGGKPKPSSIKKNKIKRISRAPGKPATRVGQEPR